MAVVIYHAFPAALPGGFVGVDIFFVISGYLISSIIFSSLADDKFSFRQFYIRRVRRIFPALLTVLLVVLVVGWFSLFADEFQQLGKHMLGGAFFFSNFVLLQEVSYFDTAAETKPLLHLWSLAIEEQFYIIWPLLAILLWRLPRLFALAVGVLVLASFAYNIVSVGTNPSATFYLPISRFWELLAGGVLALRHHHQPSLKVQTANNGVTTFASGLGLLMLIAPMLLATNKIPFPGWLALLPVIGTYLIIAAGPAAGPNRWLLSNRMMIGLGLISYPLYLWHWPILSFSLINGIGEEDTASRLILVLLSVVLAWLTSRWVERPLRFSARPLVGARGLTAAVFFLGICGYAVYDQAGFKERSFNRDVNQSSYAWKEWYRFEKCFIETKKGPEAFAEQCDTLHSTPGQRHRVVLWGDSHAASLFPGLKAQADKLGFDLAQFNANGCPPVADFIARSDEPQCPVVNAHVLGRISELRPELVVMGGYWVNYSGHGDWNELKQESIEKTIGALTSQGIRVVVIGQLPVADIPQPNIAARIFVPGEVNRTTNYFRSSQFEGSVAFEAGVRAAGAEFAAPADILCDEDGCLLSTSEATLEPVAWDYGHLTWNGAIMLVEEFVNSGRLRLPESTVSMESE